MTETKRIEIKRNSVANFSKVSSKFLDTASSSLSLVEKVEKSTAKTQDVVYKKDIFPDDLDNYRKKVSNHYKSTTVSNKFMQSAATSFQPTPKPSEIIKLSPGLKSAIKLFIFIFIAYTFLQTKTGKPVKKFISQIPDRVFNAANFVQIQRAELDIFTFTKLMLVNYRSNKKLPQDFSKFLRANFKNTLSKDAAKDPWGNFYKMTVDYNKKTFEIRSFGPDKKNGTMDDIYKMANYEIDVPMEVE